MARRDRCLGCTLAEAEPRQGPGVTEGVLVWRRGEGLAAPGVSARLTIRLLRGRLKETSAEQFAQELRERRPLRIAQQRTRRSGPTQVEHCRWRRGGARGLMESDMKHHPLGLLRVAGTNAPTPATPLR